MLNEGVSKQAHPLFFTLQRSDTLLGTVSLDLGNFER